MADIKDELNEKLRKKNALQVEIEWPKMYFYRNSNVHF